MQNEYIIEQLDSSRHDRTPFKCESQPLNEFIQKLANQQQKRHASKTFVTINRMNSKSKKIIIAYYTLVLFRMKQNLNISYQTSKGYPIPSILIGRLGVHEKSTGMGIGKSLLINAFSKIKEISERVGVTGIVVDAKHGKKSFYEKYGFTEIEKNEFSERLWLDISDLNLVLKTLAHQTTSSHH